MGRWGWGATSTNPSLPRGSGFSQSVVQPTTHIGQGVSRLPQPTPRTPKGHALTRAGAATVAGGASGCRPSHRNSGDPRCKSALLGGGTARSGDASALSPGQWWRAPHTIKPTNQSHRKVCYSASPNTPHLYHICPKQSDRVRPAHRGRALPSGSARNSDGLVQVLPGLISLHATPCSLPCAP